MLLMSQRNVEPMQCLNKKYKKIVFTLLVSIAVTTIVFANPLRSAARNGWNGFYVGANSGYSSGAANQTIKFHDQWLTDGTRDDTFLTPFVDKQLTPKGFEGGVQAGYQYQTNRWVHGVAVSVDYLGQDAKYFSGSVTNSVSNNPYTVTSSYTINWLATMRIKLGYTMDDFLPYVTGGLAIAHQKYSQNITQGNLDFYEEGSLENTVFGWTVGGGAEYALAHHWDIVIEDLFVDLSSSSVNSVGVLNGAPLSSYNATHSIQPDINIIHTGMIYRFND